MSKATAKAKITSVFKTNGSAGITGANSQSALTGMLDDVYADLAEKVGTPTNGDLIKTDASGDPVDSGISASSVSSHLASTSNPHSVTKAQVGLGNCDNTSDANKPISTATQNALNLKANAADVTSALAEKADIDGNYPLLEVGKAKDIAGADKVDAEIVFRTAGGSADIGSGTATIDKILGNSYAWNQLVSIPASSKTKTENGITFTDNRDGSYTVTTDAGGATASSDIKFNIPQKTGKKYYVNGCPVGGSTSTYYLLCAPNIYDTGDGAIVALNGDTASFPRISIENGYVNTTGLIFRPQVFDLTLIFGAGNEPATVSALKATPIGAYICSGYHAYDAGSLLSSKETGLKTVGFNQWDEQWENGYWNVYTIGLDGSFRSDPNHVCCKNKIKVIPGATYYVKSGHGGVMIGFYDINQNYLNKIASVSSSGGTFNVPNNAYYMVFYVDNTQYKTYTNDIAINLSHSGYRNGEYEPYWASQLSLPVTTITGKLNGAGSSVVVFPDGMKSAGSVRDEIVKVDGQLKKAIVKIGKRAYQAGDENDATLLTDKTNTFYPLATPQEYVLDSAINASYRIDDFGTEEIVPAQGSTPTSAPLYLSVEYGLNAKDAIRNLPKNYVSAQGDDNTLSRIESTLASVYGITMTHTWDSTNGRYNIAMSGGWRPVASAPASATATGSKGQYYIDSTYLYICVGSNSWTRVAIASW